MGKERIPEKERISSRGKELEGLLNLKKKRRWGTAQPESSE